MCRRRCCRGRARSGTGCGPDPENRARATGRAADVRRARPPSHRNSRPRASSRSRRTQRAQTGGRANRFSATTPSANAVIDAMTRRLVGSALCHGATPAATTPNEAAHASARDGRTSNAMDGADFIDDVRNRGIARRFEAGQPVPEIGVGAFEHVRECGARFAIGFFVTLGQPPAYEAVELARAAAAAPAQAFDLGSGVGGCRPSNAAVPPLPLRGRGLG